MENEKNEMKQNAAQQSLIGQAGQLAKSPMAEELMNQMQGQQQNDGQQQQPSPEAPPSPEA